MQEVMSGMSTVYIGLGSNVGLREQAIFKAIRAIDALPHTRLIATSRLYESPALLPETAPKDWDQPFINAVATFHTTLPPYELLHAMQQIEEQLGKQVRGHWGPREIDIDLLAYGNCHIQEAELTLPHPSAHLRDFVLMPWCDVAADYRLPPSGTKVREYLYKLEQTTCHPIYSHAA
tara:strand:- start:700 stop:1230 length:531 start_codon:yes stop_codon:yes gene_type:complete